MGRSSVMALMLFGSLILLADDKPVNQTRAGLAVKGYDVVAYFSEGQAVKGSADFKHAWNDATWQFASAANRDLFKSDPEKYAPRFGGYCSWAVANGYTAAIDPKAWSIVDGKLYLNYSLKIRKKWEKDIPGFIAKAEKNWPGVLD